MSEGELLTAICAEDHLPHYGTVARWCYASDQDLPKGVPPTFREAYARARELQALHFMESGIAIADETADELFEYAERRGVDVVSYNGAAVQRARLRVETRARMASLLDPRWAERRRVEKKTKRETKKVRVTEIVVRGPSVNGRPSDNGAKPTNRVAQAAS